MELPLQPRVALLLHGRIFSTTFQELNSGGKTNGWADYSKDFVFQAQVDDEPTSGATITVSFRLWAQ